MHYDKNRRTFDCEPTLTDSQVLQFCREGHLTFPGAVPDEIFVNAILQALGKEEIDWAGEDVDGVDDEDRPTSVA